MTQIMSKICRILVIAMIVICIPVSVLCASYTPLQPDKEGDYSPVIGENYSITGIAGKEAMLIFIPEDVYEDDIVNVVSAVSSNTAIVKTNVYTDDPDMCDCVDLYYKKAGTATVTITDSTGKVSVFNVSVPSDKVLTLKSRISNDFKIGQNYDLTVRVGDAPTMWCDWSAVFGDEDQNYIKSVKASKSGIVTITKADNAFFLYAKKTGKTKITVTDDLGNKSVINVTVKKADTKTKTLKNDDETSFNICTDYKLTVNMGDKLSIFCNNIDTDWDYLDSINTSKKDVAKLTLYDEFINLEAKDPGKTTITVKDYKGRKTVIYVTVKPGKSTIESIYYIYKYTKKVTVDATNVVKGDKIVLKIGNKTYTEKIKKSAKKIRVKIKIKSPGFYGKKAQVKLVRKGKTVAKEIVYVYLSDKVKKGDTKKTVRWITGWNDPDKKISTAYHETWYYDWDGDGINETCLVFKNGKVYNWQTVD